MHARRILAVAGKRKRILTAHHHHVPPSRKRTLKAKSPELSDEVSSLDRAQSFRHSLAYLSCDS